MFTELVDATGDWTQTGKVFNMPAVDTNPDAIGATYNSASTPNMGPAPGEPGWTGFGPGNYSGGYTGQGDTIYWGAFADLSSTTSAAAQSAQAPTGYVGGSGPAVGPRQQVHYFGCGGSTSSARKWQ